MHSNSTFSLYLDTLSSVRKKPRIGTFLSDSRQQPTKTDWLTDWLTNIIGRTDRQAGRQAFSSNINPTLVDWYTASPHPSIQQPNPSPGRKWLKTPQQNRSMEDWFRVVIHFFFATVHIFYRRGPMGPFCFVFFFPLLRLTNCRHNFSQLSSPTCFLVNIPTYQPRVGCYEHLLNRDFAV